MGAASGPRLVTAMRQYVLRGRLGVLDADVEIALLQPLVTQRVEQFVLADVLTTVAIRREQVDMGRAPGDTL